MTEDDKRVWESFIRNIHKYVPMISFVPVKNNDDCLDLHGLTLTQAHQKTMTFVRDAKLRGLKDVVIITGLSGKIKKEFPFWIENSPYIKRTEIRSGGGAYKIFLK